MIDPERPAQEKNGAHRMMSAPHPPTCIFPITARAT